MKTYLQLLFAFALLLLFVGCNGYEDGPAISFRSKHERMTFTRPITKYAVNGVDSLAGLMDIIRAECPGFTGNFRFEYDPEQYYGNIVWSDTTIIKGGWSNLGKYESFSMIFVLKQPFPGCCWDVMRLSNRALWLRMDRGSSIRELRFEE